MSARAGDWHLLGHGRDPVPGEPGHVSRLATGYERTADDIERLAGQLRRLSDLHGWKGDAAEKFGESAQDLAGDLGDARRRYEELARAVRGWVEPLSRARDESLAALREAERAEDDARRYSHDPYAGVAEPTPDQVAASQRRDAARQDALDRKRDAQRRLDSALAELDAAAGRTSEAIRGAAEHGADSAWDNVKGSIRDIAGVLKAIVDVLSWVAMALAAITLVVVLFVGAPFWLLALSVGVGLAMLIGRTALVVSESGQATWTDVGMDALGVATAFVGGRLALGAGRTVTGLTAQAGREAADAASTAAMALARGQANYTRASNALRIGNAANPLRVWGQQYVDDAARVAATEGAEAATRVQAGVVTRAPWSERLLRLDRDLAEDLLEVQRLQNLPNTMQVTLSDDIVRGLAGATRTIHQATAFNAANLAVQSADSADQLSETFDGPESLQWKDEFHQDLTEVQWRLTRE